MMSTIDLPTAYLFESGRLAFRNWSQDDLKVFAQMNADDSVMEHFPTRLSEEETKAYMVRLHDHYKIWGYTYYAVDLKESDEFIGFIGLAYKEYHATFTPCVDIGWRLKSRAWGKGYATEGAKRCLEHGFQDLGLDRIIATCTVNNLKSEAVMKKIGMTMKGHFDHPSLKDYPEMQNCIWYEILKEEFSSAKQDVFNFPEKLT